ncbi:outer membrane beta-barrel protein [Rhodobacteraceae bacterium F11138]|nr:outer membrane beta-barrel protein [Rhodobacteraceae bacterium F11138]
MIRTTAIAFALTTTAGVGTAFAGNTVPATVEPVVYQAPAPTFSWEGGYIGGQIGYAFSDFNLDSNTLSNFDENSVIGGINAGYLWSLGNGWYLGPEFQYDWTDLSVVDASNGQSATFDGIARLKLKAGYELGNGMLYGTAGFAYADFNSVSSVTDIDKDSYVIGFGYDWRVGENWTVGGEYMYHNFDGAGSAGGDVNLNTIHVKASYHF